MARASKKMGSEGHRALVALGISAAELARVLGVGGSVARSWMSGDRVPRGGARRKLEEAFPQVSAASWSCSPSGARPVARASTKAPASAPTKSPASKSASSSATVRELVEAAAAVPDAVAELTELLEAVRDCRRVGLSPGELAKIATTEAALVEKIDRLREAARAREVAAPVGDAVLERDALRAALHTVLFLLEWHPVAREFVRAAVDGDLDGERMAVINGYAGGQAACGADAVDLHGLARALDGLRLDGDKDDQIDAVAEVLVGARRARLRGRAS